MMDDGALDFKSVGIDGMFFGNGEQTILENFLRGNDLHASTVSNEAMKLFLRERPFH